MTSDDGWSIRHIYTEADRRFESYLAAMATAFRQARGEGWIVSLESCPVSWVQEIEAALRVIRPDELVICDLHGWMSTTADDEHVLKLAATDSDEGASLPGLYAWTAPVALIVTSCTSLEDGQLGDWARWRESLQRRCTSPMALMAHFGTARFWDHSAIEVVKAVLAEAVPGDAEGAFNAMDRSLYGDENGWFAELVAPVRTT